MNLIHNPTADDQKKITRMLWTHNANFHPVEILPFIINYTNDTGQTEAGLVAQTWWGGLEIQYLWVSDVFRGKGYGRG